MRGLIEKRASEPVTLMIPNGSFIDGRPCTDQIPALAMVMEFTQRDEDWVGKIAGGLVFLIPPQNEPPTPNTVIEYGNRRYDIAGVKTYRNIRGKIIGYRCAAAGGI